MPTTTFEPRMRKDRPPRDLPATPEEIDLERIVDDPEYRQAVKDLLKRWDGERDRERERGRRRRPGGC